MDEIFRISFSSVFLFRSKRSAHDAIEQVLEYLDSDYQWVIDLDVEKYFDTVNHDKLISTLDKR
ncbi:reverse transcriptase domain-containing protein [Limosilactobacillus reuteri]|uniref:Reverse transcriptase domain-containing protein n=1 Tax=Limosilactobacillus reuteri TaxID=1598 RepID=A0AAW6JF97_LIMRT|nr:reverse transcriptase domain-containing protein [Limosilactobacillus reuteri]MCC4500045.1 hypothetical protein [Limosilactobacillus reuteri]MCC4505020.1 hypothetical protein [Limosilactobacillus reuteri]MCC4507451.1 hypothetical protein [Limosilactobacillus reuteri]MCC4516659.1 hypothetical protein [Limosilactobacillus reuteri]MDD1382524.1 reverse transcriptase domain-containing protein [Limosilactobacillus reuteri]